MENFCGFCDLAIATENVSNKIFINLVNKVLHEQHNRESFLTNFNKTLQPRKFSTINDLHYTVAMCKPTAYR